MNLKAQLTEDMKNAMRARDAVKLGVIRFLMSDIKNTEIDNGELDDAGVQKVVAKEIKSMRDAMTEYEKGGRQDLIDEETAKIAVLETYLPAQMSDEELTAVIQKVIDQAPVKQMGPIIGQVMSQVQGQADGGRVSALVKQLLV